MTKLRQWSLLLFWPVYGLAFYALEWILPRSYYHPVWHPVDEMIPFCELFVIPYVFWYVYMAGSVIYTLFRNPVAYRRVMYFYMVVFSVSTVVFFLWPTCQNFRPAAFPRDNMLTRIMGVLYSMDTSTNVCPSLHVSGSIGAALGFTDSGRFSSPLWRVIHTVIATLICLSTLFVRQHSVIDVFWGVMLSWVAWVIVYRPLPDGKRFPIHCPI